MVLEKKTQKANRHNRQTDNQTNKQMQQTAKKKKCHLTQLNAKAFITCQSEPSRNVHQTSFLRLGFSFSTLQIVLNLTSFLSQHLLNSCLVKDLKHLKIFKFHIEGGRIIYSVGVFRKNERPRDCDTLHRV